MSQVADQKYRPTFDKFEIWSAKHLSLDKLSNSELLSQIKHQKYIDCLLEFGTFETIQTFLTEKKPSEQKSPPIESDFHIIMEYKSVPIVWVSAHFDWIDQIISDPRILYVHGNSPLYLCLNEINNFFELEPIHQSFFGFSGKNVTIGIIDSGIDQTHPDLKGKILDSINASTESEGDMNGHGTMMAGIICGNGIQSESLYHGVAPDANLYDFKIFNHQGQAMMVDLLVLLDLILARSKETSPDLLVFGGTAGPFHDEQHPLLKYLFLLKQRGILTIIPVGNFGPDPDNIGFPALSKDVISVGSIDFEKKTAFFSARIRNNSEIFKPDYLIPGVKIVAPHAILGNIGTDYLPNPNYHIFSGTSISAAVFSGLVAVLKEVYPTSSANDLLSILRSNVNISSEGIPIPDIFSHLSHKELLLARPLSYRTLLNRAFNWSIISIGFLIGLFYLLKML